ncbi:Uncharacterised protein [Moraxella equi]|uniref:Uncharacterized protein n=1 Tax=Moraxella equi TaxID=60442 RepID=A0A378UR94_9GAMM|nr:Uncharacterised protein [Moraxella equi]STZ82977.1 Uncharacterised protein [Moraxella equi]
MGGFYKMRFKGSSVRFKVGLVGGVLPSTTQTKNALKWAFLRVFEKFKNFRIFDGLNLGLWKREPVPKFVLVFLQRCSKQGKAVF